LRQLQPQEAVFESSQIFRIDRIRISHAVGAVLLWQEKGGKPTYSILLNFRAPGPRLDLDLGEELLALTSSTVNPLDVTPHQIGSIPDGDS
jgi:hypothetical protein